MRDSIVLVSGMKVEGASRCPPGCQVALEATGNRDAIAALLAAHVERVVVSNPVKTRAIAEAKVKTDKVDARILAQLLAADFLPPVWLPDDRTARLRRMTTSRAHLVRQRTRIKNRIQAILHRNLMPRPPVTDPFGKTGRAWLERQPLPEMSGLRRHRCCDSWTSSARNWPPPTRPSRAKP